jgi:hypothetical protein
MLIRRFRFSGGKPCQLVFPRSPFGLFLCILLQIEVVSSYLLTILQLSCLAALARDITPSLRDLTERRYSQTTRLQDILWHRWERHRNDARMRQSPHRRRTKNPQQVQNGGVNTGQRRKQKQKQRYQKLRVVFVHLHCRSP